MLPHEIVPKIMRCFDLIRQGRSPTASARDCLITWGTVRRYCDKDDDLRSMMLEAIQEGQDTLADILLEIDRDPHYGQSDPAMAKIISENIKWLLARRRPQEYGDRQTVDVNLKADAVILAALNAAKLRTPPMLELQATPVAPALIDAEVEALR